MLKIINIQLSRLRASQHLRLMIELIRLILEETSSRLGIEFLFPAFQSAVAKETVAVEVERGSSITEKIDALIISREKCFGGLNNLVENGQAHFDPTKVDAAKKLRRVMDKYENIQNKTKGEKLVDFQNLTLELQTAENAPYCLLLGVSEWVDKIQEVNAECNTQNALRTKENGERPDGNVHDARMVVDPLYNAIVERVNALAVVNGDANYQNFITQLNVVIENLKITLAQQQPKKEKPAEK